MKAIIMAGGFGTRLRPLTVNVPKPMVPVGNMPMMEHVVALLKKHGITDIASLLYFQAATIKEHFGDGSAFGINMTYVQPDDDYGTAGAVRFAAKDATEPILVISGDLITDFDLGKAMQWHKEKKAEATILLTRAENPLAYGIVITDENDRIVRFLEKPSWGEAFSDTINTGIYLLEPSAINLIPLGDNYDFSQNLYPLMLSKKMGLYGMTMEGYWKDVGNVDEYRFVHSDLYSGKVEIDLAYKPEMVGDAKLYRGKNVQIGEDTEIQGTVILGDDVTVGPQSILRNCTIGERSTVGHGCKVKETTIWSDVVLGSRSMLSSAIVCNRSRLGDSVQLLDKAIVSDDCTLGNEVAVRANCKIWPSKSIENGATVSSSLVWGEKWNRELFTDSKVTGLALIETTPDMCVRLGAAIGATLGVGTAVVTSRDASDITRLLRRGLISGLLAAGVNISDLETMPIPVVRHALSKGKHSAGIYMRHNPDDYRLVDIIVFDGAGLDMPNARLKKIERNYFGEDFERATLDTIGHLDRTPRVIDDYREEFLSVIDADKIRSAGFKIVIDHCNGSSAAIFPTLFSLLGVSTTELNANLNPRKFSTSVADQARATVQLSAIVSSLNADLGLALNPSAEKLTVVDENGKPIDANLLLLLVVDLHLQCHQPKSIAVPVSASMGVEEIAGSHGVEVIRVADSHSEMMKVKSERGIEFVGGTRGGFIFPGFQRGADAILTTAKLLEMMATTHARLGELRGKYQRYCRSEISVPCPWGKKGLVMRRLITESVDKDRQLIDGVRIFEKNGWVLVAPDRFDASFNIVAESNSSEETAGLISRYQTIVEDCQES